MRKEDRLRQQQGQEHPDQRPEQSQRRPDEQVKGSVSTDKTNRPPRQPGRLPLPE